MGFGRGESLGAVWEEFMIRDNLECSIREWSGEGVLEWMTRLLGVLTCLELVGCGSEP